MSANSLAHYRGHRVGFHSPHLRDDFVRAVTAFDEAIELREQSGSSLPAATFATPDSSRPRVILRDWLESDLDTFSSWSQPGHEWQRLDGPYYPAPTVDQVSAQVAKLRERILAAEWPTPRHVLPVVERKTGRLLGKESRYWQSEETNWLSIGIVIFDSADWRHGFGLEALSAWVSYLFESMPQLPRLVLRTWSGNHGMVALACKLGFREEARFRKARVVDGVAYDGLGFGLLREEWR